MFKLSWFGKYLLAKTAIEAAGTYFENKERQELEEDTFSEPEVRALAEAVLAGNFAKFQQLYTFRRRWADANNVAEAYETVRRNL